MQDFKEKKIPFRSNDRVITSFFDSSQIISSCFQISNFCDKRYQVSVKLVLTIIIIIIIPELSPKSDKSNT